MKSLSERAFCEIERRLRGVRKADGYETDAGRNVFRSLRSVEVDDSGALVLWDGGESATGEAGHPSKVALTVNIEGHVLADKCETGTALEEIKADIKRAVLSESNGALAEPGPQAREYLIGTIRYTGAQPSPREEGSTSESIVLTFEVGYVEGVGNPYSSQDRT
ncbi:MAG: hypothetical protein E6Q97_06135 [Desulfurellales bacterium]|nr:MAG: hypothetical protein E6Q97_06135 [Desulfurellales bacterium]